MNLSVYLHCSHSLLYLHVYIMTSSTAVHTALVIYLSLISATGLLLYYVKLRNTRLQAAEVRLQKISHAPWQLDVVTLLSIKDSLVKTGSAVAIDMANMADDLGRGRNNEGSVAFSLL